MALGKLFGLGGLAKKIKDKLTAVKGGALVKFGSGGALVKTSGWLFKAVPVILLAAASFVLSQLMQFLVGGVQQILNFNWNSSDTQLKQQIEGAKLALASVAGEGVGNAAGYVVCGALPGAQILIFNKDLGIDILRNVGEEGLEELTSNVYALTQLTFQSLFGYSLITLYSSNRAMFRQARDEIGGVLLWPLGGEEEWKKYAHPRDRDGRSVTFAEGLEKVIEAIPNPFLRQFAEEAYEGFFGGCFEAGFIVGNGIESWVLRNRASRGRSMTVVVQPNRAVEHEKIIVHGSEETLIETLPQLMADHQYLGNRQIGTVLALPPEERIRRQPNSRKITITFRSTQRPPWRPTDPDGDYWEFSVEIPDAKRNITWEKVKLACGGANGFMAGRFTAVATSKRYRDIPCPGATRDAAVDRLKALLELSEQEYFFIDVKEEVKEGVRLTNDNLWREPIRVYPSSFTILSHEKILGGETGIPTTVGNLRRQRYTIDLWPSEEPDDAAEMINDLFGNQDLTP